MAVNHHVSSSSLFGGAIKEQAKALALFFYLPLLPGALELLTRCTMKEYRINLNDEEYRLDEGRPLSDLFEKKEQDGYPLVAALFNNELYSLNSPPQYERNDQGSIFKLFHGDPIV